MQPAYLFILQQSKSEIIAVLLRQLVSDEWRIHDQSISVPLLNF